MAVLVAHIALAQTAKPPPDVPPHILLIAAQRLCEGRQLDGHPGGGPMIGESCNQIVDMAFGEPGLTTSDRAALHLLHAMRAADVGDESSEAASIVRALQFDINSEAPPFANKAFTQALRRQRNILLRANESNSGTAMSPEKSRQEARKAAAKRSPSIPVLFTAMKKLYERLDARAVDVVLKLARESKPSPEEEVQLFLWQGLVCMENTDQVGAEASFKEALSRRPDTKLMDLAPPRTQRVFEGVKSKLMPPPPKVPAASSPAPSASSFSPDISRWLLLGGGGALLGGGALAAGSYLLGCPDGDCTVANIGIGTGWSVGAAGVAGLLVGVLWMTHPWTALVPPSPQQPTIVPSLGPGTVQLTGTF